MSVTLGPGDVLYIPRGFAHHAATAPALQPLEPPAPVPPTLAAEGNGKPPPEGNGKPPPEGRDHRKEQDASLHVTFGVEVEAPFE